MLYKGPAIKVGCVTRRKHRAESKYFSQQIVTVQDAVNKHLRGRGTYHYKSVLRAGAVCKNRDKQLTFIVLCIVSRVFIIGYLIKFWAIV